MVDSRIPKFLEAAAAYKRGDFNFQFVTDPQDEVGRLGEALRGLGQQLHKQSAQSLSLFEITSKINQGRTLDQVLNSVYKSFRGLLPYDRIGLSLLVEGGRVVRARWARSESAALRIGEGYEAALEGSSLQNILKTGTPRILNDLEEYLAAHPNSASTRLIVEEGMRSSLTCPLIAAGQPIGFLYFSSMQAHSYQDLHADSFLRIAGELATIVEKSRLYQQLLEANDLKNKFLGMAAHDLRHPLAVIRNYAALLRDGFMGDLAPAQSDIIGRIDVVSDGMFKLIDALLNVNAIESGQLRLVLKPDDLKAVLKDLHEQQRLLASSKKIELVLNVPEDLPAVVIDAARIGQVLGNLISNALKFSQPGTKVMLKAAVQGADVLVAVQDHGPGIPESEQKSMFVDFGKTSVQPTAGEKGFGLGLAICRRIVEAHGGRIGVDSKVGEGSVFWFTLSSRQTSNQFAAHCVSADRSVL